MRDSGSWSSIEGRFAFSEQLSAGPEGGPAAKPLDKLALKFRHPLDGKFSFIDKWLSIKRDSTL
jgi:hypothetical protein